MRRMWPWAFVLVAVSAGCAREPWPSPPPIDPAAYQKEYDAWLEGERAYLSKVLPVIGLWPLDEGETSFGSDPALPIVLPAAHVQALSGKFRRSGGTVTIVPAAGADLRLKDGSRLEAERQMEPVAAGPLQLQVVSAGDARRWVRALDTTHPAIANPPQLPSYPVDAQWRVAARFDAFEQPKRIRVPDVRGGSMEFSAVGQLVFRLNGEELRLTAIGVGGKPYLAVWFKDTTNGSTTYRGYRSVQPRLVKNGEWTVIDFNLAFNPPCAYSSFTTCPLPPPENRLPVAIEAGLKRPSVEGY